MLNRNLLSLLLTLAVSPALAQFPSTNLVEHWTLNEASGNRAGSKSAYSLTDNGTVLSTTGKIGSASDHLAANSEFLEATITELNSATTATYSAWAKRAAGSDTLTVGTANSAGTQRCNILIWTDGNIYVQVGVASGTTYGFCASTVSNGSWGHYVLVYNGAAGTNAGKLKFYINGAEQTLTFSGTIPTALPTNANQGPFTVGLESGTRYSTGQFDEVAVWNAALSAGDVTALYNGGSGLTYTADTFTPQVIIISDATARQRKHREQYGVYAIAI